MKEFVTAAREEFTPDDEGAITFEHDGRKVTFYQPNTAQFALMAAMDQGGDEMDLAGTYLATFLALCDPDSRRYFWGRLMDRTDTFDLDSTGGVKEIMEYLLEEWSARPTKQPSDFRRPQSQTGSRSTATSRAGASTSSATRRAGSSTSSKSG